MLEFAVAALVGVLVMWVVIMIGIGLQFFWAMRAVNKQSEGLRLAPLRDRDHDRKLY